MVTVFVSILVDLDGPGLDFSLRLDGGQSWLILSDLDLSFGLRRSWFGFGLG